MWIVFEGLDKVGKTTLEWELLKATNFKHVIVDRGPIGYMVHDGLLGRETKLGNLEFIFQAQEMMRARSGFMVVYCYAREDVINKRLKDHNEEQLDCNEPYSEMQRIYRENVEKFYRPEKTLMLDTSDKTIEECINLIISKIEEVLKYEQQKRKSGTWFR